MVEPVDEKVVDYEDKVEVAVDERRDGLTKV
jgi:hypothetical protein